MKKLIVFLLLAASIASAQTLNRATVAGKVSLATNWSTGVSPCGAGGDGIFLAIQATMVLDCSLGSVATGINDLFIESGGSLCSYDGTHNTCGNTSTQGTQTIYFNSTGTNAIGAGTVFNPGSGATMMGLYVSYGTFQFIGDASDVLVFRAATSPTTNPIYMVHPFNGYSGGTAITTTGQTGGANQSTHGAVGICKFCWFQSPLGTASTTTGFEGISFETKTVEVTPTSLLDIENSELDSPYQINAGSSSCSNCAMANWTLNNNWFNGATNTSTFGLININNSNATQNYTITNNTDTGAVNSSQTAIFVNKPLALTFTGNVVTGNAAGTVPRGVLKIGTIAATSGPWTLNGNMCLNVEGTITIAADCMSTGYSITDTTSTENGNICWGGYHCYYFGNPSGTTNGPVISGNWGAIYKEATTGQGVFGSLGFFFRLDHNISILENDNLNVINIFYSNGVGTAVYQIDNMTTYSAAVGSSQGVNFGDSTGAGSAIASPSWYRSSIVVGSNYGVINNTANTWSGTLCGAGTTGVCNNAVFGVTSGREYCGNGTTCASHGTGSGWDNGTNFHPNAIYGDLATATNPNFLDVTRRPTTYASSQCGGLGTIADLGAQYALRDGMGSAYNTCYNIATMLAWLQAGFASTNSNFVSSGFGGTYIGAVPPIIATVGQGQSLIF